MDFSTLVSLLSIAISVGVILAGELRRAQAPQGRCDLPKPWVYASQCQEPAPVKVPEGPWVVHHYDSTSGVRVITHTFHSDGRLEEVK